MGNEKLISMGSPSLLEQALVFGQLRSLLPLNPSFENQTLWAKYFEDFELNRNLTTWELLHTFQLPLINRYGSSAHRKGIKLLGLQQEKPPSFYELSNRLFEISGWRLRQVYGEIPPENFFEALSQKILPCVNHMRPIEAVFSSYEPDFWHEIVGHASCLADQDFAEFYSWCGQLVTSMGPLHQLPKAKTLCNILWVILEYGFIIEENELKSFGAALTGSYMGLRRFSKGHLKIVPFNCQLGLNSNLYNISKSVMRDKLGRIKMFYTKSLFELKSQIEHWCNT